jgi:hypothetical protein
MVFGQNRQEDMIGFLEKTLTPEQAQQLSRNLALNLSPGHLRPH